MGTYTSKYTGEEIDNLLGQVENGGGSGSGYSETVLFEGEAGAKTNTQVTTTVTLAQSVKNFDTIGFYCIGVYNTYLRYIYNEVPTDMFINFINDTAQTNRISFIHGFKDSPAYWDIVPTESTDTTLRVITSLFYVTKIVGIKY